MGPGKEACLRNFGGLVGYVRRGAVVDRSLQCEYPLISQYDPWQQVNEIKNLIIYLIMTMNIETIQVNEAHKITTGHPITGQVQILDSAAERTRIHF